MSARAVAAWRALAVATLAVATWGMAARGALAAVAWGAAPPAWDTATLQTQQLPGAARQQATSLTGQPATVATAVVPDTGRVGRPLLFGVTVRSGSATAVGFPAILPLSDPLEQRGAVEQRSEVEEGVWRAYYRVVAWQAGEHSVPAFEVSLRGAAGERRLETRPATFRVRTVLPTDTAGLELREARAFLTLAGPPWGWWLLLLLAAAAFAYWLWSRQRTPAPVAAGPVSPAERALARFKSLRSGWRAGALSTPALFDGLERALRDYAAATQAWRPGASLRRLAAPHRALSLALERSALVRFARWTPPDEAPLAAVAAGEAWVVADAGEGDGEAGDREGDGEVATSAASEEARKSPPTAGAA